MSIHPAMCHWILHFLTNRQQRVKVGEKLSSPLTLNIGAPQGCVLSPQLFSLYTNNLTSQCSSVKIFKYADDTTIIGLISDNNESQYHQTVDSAVKWCADNNLQLNTSKTLEIIIDFRRNQNHKPPVHVNSHPITSTNSFKFLGTYISNNLKWHINADHVIKKGQQRLYFLRQLKKFRVHKHLLVRFYQSIIESIITSSITVWYGNTDSHSLHRIQRIVSKASRIINSPLPSIHSIYLQRTSKRAKKIISDHSHPANHLFQSLPSGRRLRSLATKTTRFKNSFFPSAIRTLNSVQ